MDGVGTEVRGKGRPRDEAKREAILAATRRLVLQDGYEAVSTQMIAAAAGVGKQTLYRRWPSKPELVLDAFLAFAKSRVDAPWQETVPIQDQVAGFMRRTFAALTETAPAVRSLMAIAQQDAGFRAVFRSRFVEPRRRSLAGLLKAAIAGGQAPPDLDVELAVVMLYGAVWYRLLLDEALEGPPPDPAWPDRLAAHALGTGPARPEMGGAGSLAARRA